ncbi:MAG: hypothetical protein WDW38_006200 [Sanguina aurantia]
MQDIAGRSASAICRANRVMDEMDEDVTEWFRDSITCSLDDIIVTPNVAHVKHAFKLAFFFLHKRTRFEEALAETCRKLGDTDTNCAVVGAVMGALHGKAHGVLDSLRGVAEARRASQLQRVVEARHYKDDEQLERLHAASETVPQFHVDDMSSAPAAARGGKAGRHPTRGLERLRTAGQAQLHPRMQVQQCDGGVHALGQLKKTGSMEVGQVGFHNNREVRKYKVEKRSTEIVNRMEKTKQERHPDLAEERLVGPYEAGLRSVRNAEGKASRAALKIAKDEHRKAEETKSYKTIMQDEYMVSNKELAAKYASVEDYEDDFM